MTALLSSTQFNLDIKQQVYGKLDNYGFDATFHLGHLNGTLIQSYLYKNMNYAFYVFFKGSKASIL
jgi:hypothetical protein